MKKKIITILAALFCVFSVSAETLSFDANKGTSGSITMPDGKVVKYTAYTHLSYATNPLNPDCQYLNVFVPEGADQTTPIFMRNYVGGYMESKPGNPKADDASGRALEEGYVLVIPGARGSNSHISSGRAIYTGRAPRALVDLKAAVRYLRYFDKDMLGDAEKIITDGTSAGGALSALLGATANDHLYEPYLEEMGAAPAKDDIYASVCYCPITDLAHADMTYEWLYGNVDRESRLNTEDLQRISDELASQFPAYVQSLDLCLEDGKPLTADNYLLYIKQLLMNSAQQALKAGDEIPVQMGFVVNGKKVTDLDMEAYLAYVATQTPLKPCPAFDNKGVAGNKGSLENDEFGDRAGKSANFTDYSIQQASKDSDAYVSKYQHQLVAMMNPIDFILDNSSNVARFWYIRHGTLDRDTAFPIPINLANLLYNTGKDVDFKLAWNQPHAGDYELDDLFNWIAKIIK